MNRLVEFKLSEESSILVEVDELESPGLSPVAVRPGRVAAEAQKTFEQALDKLDLDTMASILKKKLGEMREPANEVEVSFGVKLSGQIGAVITAGAEATYQITLKWNK